MGAVDSERDASEQAQWPKMAAGFGFPLGCAAGFAVTTVASVAGLAGHAVLGAVMLGGTVAVTSAVTTVPAAVGCAVACWALYAGFIVGRAGELAFTRASSTALGVFALVAALGLACRALLRGPRQAQERPVVIPKPRPGRQWSSAPPAVPGGRS